MADSAGYSDFSDAFSEQTLPHSDEAEQAVLGAILVDPEMISVALEHIRPEYFHLEQHKMLFHVMLSIFQSGGEEQQQLDQVVVVHEAVREGVFESETEGRNYLRSLMEGVPSAENIVSYCRIVAERYCARQLATVARELLHEISVGSESAQTLLDSAEQRIYDIRQGRDVHGLVPIRDVVVSTFDYLRKITGPDREQYIGAKTGYPELDAVTGGMNNSDLVILAARPGMGKTSFALNLATNVARRTGREVAIYSLEMGMEQLASRMISTEALVNAHKLRTGRMEPAEWNRIASSADVLSRLNLRISEATGITVPQMKAQLRRVKNLGMVVIDYLQLMDAPLKSDNRVLVISDITRNLKLMAKELNVPVLLLSQLNRGVESRTDKRPMMSDLRESGSIEQDADIIMFLYNDFYYQKERTDAPVEVECIVAKNRHGSTGTINMIWDPQFTRFSPKEQGEAPPE